MTQPAAPVLSQGSAPTQRAEPVRSQDATAQARITAIKPAANLDSRRLRLIPPPGEGGGKEEKEEKEEKVGAKKEEEKGEKEKEGKEEKDIENSEIEARFDGTNGKPVVSIAPYVQSAKAVSKVQARKEEGDGAKPGLKKRRSRKGGEEEMPPTPLGCEWLKTEDGWNLWRYWSEKDQKTGNRIKKGRYAGYLSRGAWRVMKGYDYETFISIIGQRLRRYGQR
jgi:hypothetical protein